METKGLYLTEAQLRAEVRKCEYCEEKPCREACPVNCSPTDFIKAVEVGNPSDFKRAAAEIMMHNPFGGVCGLVCPDRTCMSGCVYKGFNIPIQIPKVQATIIKRARDLNVFPKFEKAKPNGKKVAIIGGGPAGFGAAAYLSQNGYTIDMYEKKSKLGGACNLIPDYRLPKDMLENDIEFVKSFCNINIKTNTEITDPQSLLNQGYEAVIVATGLPIPYKLNIPNEELAVSGTDYLENPTKYKFTGNVAVIGGGATACDCAIIAKLNGASRVEMFALENAGEMPLTLRERMELLENGIDINGRIRVTAIKKDGDKIVGLDTIKIELEKGKKFNLKDLKDIPGSQATRNDIDHVIIAIGNHSGIKEKINNDRIFYAGDCSNGPTTVVEAMASGKNVAQNVIEVLNKKNTTKFDNPIKSRIKIPGYNNFPVPLETEFFGRKIISPFILSAAPPSDGLEQMKKAYEAGWAGGVMKTAFDGVPIHIPGEYMTVFSDRTYGNCDNVSGHPLDRVCKEVSELVKLYPDRLTMASTGGSVTGNDESDKKVWQKNTKKLEDAGAMGIEYSLSCPQGGDGTEGDIVSQNAALTAKIIDWVMEVSNPDIPKLFKLTAAVTSIIPILNAIKAVFNKYPNKKAGVTLANTFPCVGFRPGKKKEWDEGIIFGMSGEGVTPISNLTLSNAVHTGIKISGNGGPMNYKAAADFLAMGVETVQFCTLPTKFGYGIINDLMSGISHYMEQRGIKSMKELIGIALPNIITGFMDLSPVKKISAVNPDLCEHCGNCSRCPYLAIKLDDKKIPVTDPSKCIGCSICAQKCFAKALYMRDRTPEEAKMLKED